MSLPALHHGADIRSITERVNVLIRDHNSGRVADLATLLAQAWTNVQVRVFNSSGTYTPHADMVAGFGIAKGGGAGGANDTAQPTLSHGTGGGGEGATAIKYFTRASVLPNQAVTIGAGGGSGGAGGSTSLGSLLFAGGGAAGGYQGGAGGTTATGDIIIRGAAGSSGMLNTQANAVGVGGSGGGAGGGPGGVAGGAGQAFTGTAGATNSGGGGGGAASRAAGPGVINGAAGGSGVLYVVEVLKLP